MSNSTISYHTLSDSDSETLGLKRRFLSSTDTSATSQYSLTWACDPDRRVDDSDVTSRIREIEKGLANRLCRSTVGEQSLGSVRVVTEWT